MISVRYSVKDDDLLTMYREDIKTKGTSTIDPFLYQTFQSEDIATIVKFALMKATAVRVDGFKKSASVDVDDDGNIKISVIDVASKKP